MEGGWEERGAQGRSHDRSACAHYIWVMTGWGSAERALGGSRGGVRGRARQSAMGVARGRRRGRGSPCRRGRPAPQVAAAGLGRPRGRVGRLWLGAGAAGAAAGAAAAGMCALSNPSAAVIIPVNILQPYSSVARFRKTLRVWGFESCNPDTIHCRNRAETDPLQKPEVVPTHMMPPSSTPTVTVPLSEWANVSHNLAPPRLAQALISHSSLITATCSCAWPPHGGISHASSSHCTEEHTLAHARARR